VINLTTEYSKKIETIRSLIRDAGYAAKNSHEILFADSNKNEIRAGLFLNNAISLMTCAKSIYISSYELLEKQEVEDIFNEFDVFTSEFFECLKTNHSHQWTDIHYNRFKDAFESFIGEL
jgi:hypothetical protein